MEDFTLMYVRIKYDSQHLVSIGECLPLVFMKHAAQFFAGFSGQLFSQ